MSQLLLDDYWGKSDNGITSFSGSRLRASLKVYLWLIGAVMQLHQ